jgi:hypothetical protein
LREKTHLALTICNKFSKLNGRASANIVLSPKAITAGMNSTKSALLLAAIVLGSVAAADADANGRHFRHHHSRSHVGIWFTVPGPFFYPPPYYSPRYYYPPAVVVPAPVSSPTYIERPVAEAAAPAESGAYWYYCRNTQTYYPYVQQCASPWERVVPNSVPPS